jgi:hypothetical protein
VSLIRIKRANLPSRSITNDKFLTAGYKDKTIVEIFMRRYALPPFLESVCDQQKYGRWLQGATRRHIKRDRDRGNSASTPESYRLEIHNAVLTNGEFDAYTGERLDWLLICTYNNAEAKAKGRQYKALFALMPTVDHVGDGTGAADFKICAWRTNDAKNDLSYEKFLALCRRVYVFGSENRTSTGQTRTFSS